MKPGFAEEAIPHMDAVYRFALRLARGRADVAEDLLQETYLRAYRAWEGFRPGSNAKSWLFTICRNVFLRSVEWRRVRPDSEAESLGGEIDALADPDPRSDPATRFFDSIVDEQVVHQLDRLPDDFREVVVMRDLHDLSYAEISEALSIPIGTVRSRLHRGRALLQRALRAYALEEGYLRPGKAHV
jgi:RNA polymerase sigma-70 factor (ECF subfamily)